jgi:hypothetical protein
MEKSERAMEMITKDTLSIISRDYRDVNSKLVTRGM